VLLPALPDPELPLAPLLLEPLPCCRHLVRSVPVRPVHWLDEVVLPPALPPLPDVPLLLPELMLEPVLPPLLLPLLDCAHDTAATPTSAAVTAAPITVFTMVPSSRLKWKNTAGGTLQVRCRR
jgi:hypothetical protein